MSEKIKIDFTIFNQKLLGQINKNKIKITIRQFHI